MLSKRGVVTALAVSACSTIALAAKCTTVTDEYPFFLYGVIDGTPIFDAAMALVHIDSTTIGLGLNLPPVYRYPTAFNLNKQNLLSKDNDLKSMPYISQPLPPNGFVTFNKYNGTTNYGLIGLQQDTRNIPSLGTDSCALTVNHELVPLYLCPGPKSAKGALLLTYQADPSRYCLNVTINAYSEGGGKA